MVELYRYNFEEGIFMEYQTIELNNGAIEYRVSGELTAYSLNKLENAIMKVVDTDECPHISFDFSELEYLDSQGIRLLVIAGKYDHAKGKKLNIKSLSDRVKRTLELAELMFINYVD